MPATLRMGVVRLVVLSHSRRHQSPPNVSCDVVTWVNPSRTIRHTQDEALPSRVCCLSATPSCNMEPSTLHRYGIASCEVLLATVSRGHSLSHDLQGLLSVDRVFVAVSEPLLQD